MDRIFYQINGLSITTDIDAVRELLGECGEPSPSLPPVAILSPEGSLASLPAGTQVFRVPGQALIAAARTGLPIDADGESPEDQGSPQVVATSREVVASITATQIRLWLFRRGIPLSAVEAAIGSIEDEAARGEAMILWEYAPYVERENPLVSLIGESLGLSREQLDEAFAEAASL